MRSGTEIGEVRQRYNQRQEIWTPTDHWHAHTYIKLQLAVTRLTRLDNLDGAKILNVGSAGNAYGLAAENHFHTDIAENHLEDCERSVVATAEALPFADNTFDLVLCVGSVLNYCDAVAVCHELHRVLKTGGVLLLEFESSCSGEYLFKRQFARGLIQVQTTFQGGDETIWLFNPRYLRSVLLSLGFIIKHDEGIHAVTAIAYRFCKRIDTALCFAPLDDLPLIARVFRSLACNRVFLAKKVR